MKLSALLKDLQKDFEIKEPFAEMGPEVFMIPVDEGVRVELAQTGQGITLSATVIDMPLGKEDELYAHLLSANLFGQGTRGALLALSDDARRLTLSREIDYDVNFKEFKDIFEDFILAIDFWRDEVLNYQG